MEEANTFHAVTKLYQLGVSRRSGSLLLAFENLDKTQAAFNSAAYAKALMYGEKYAEFKIYAVEGLDPTATE